MNLKYARIFLEDQGALELKKAKAQRAILEVIYAFSLYN
jgi:hypothetical protein